MTVEQNRVTFERDRFDPLLDFSIVCREEFLEIAGAGAAGDPLTYSECPAILSENLLLLRENYKSSFTNALGTGP